MLCNFNYKSRTLAKYTSKNATSNCSNAGKILLYWATKNLFHKAFMHETVEETALNLGQRQIKIVIVKCLRKKSHAVRLITVIWGIHIPNKQKLTTGLLRTAW